MKFLSKYFDFPENSKFDSFGSGHMNETWRVSCDGQNLYALRRYNSSRSISEIDSEHNALMTLKKVVGEQIVTPINSRNGKTIEKIGERFYSLFPFVIGDIPKDDNSQHITLAAETLAELHKKLWLARSLFMDVASLRQPISKYRLLTANEIYNELLSEHTEEKLKSQCITSELFFKLEKKCSEVLDRLEPYIKERQLIHGDFGASNLLINCESNSVNAILDWEEMRWDSPLFELAGVIGFYEMDNPGTGKLFLSSYVDKIKKISHPNERNIIMSLDKINDAMFCANYLELTLMIESGHFELEYIQELCQTMA